MFFAKSIGKNVAKNVSKILCSKYGQKPIDHAKQSTTDAIKTASKAVTEKTSEAAGDLNGNKIADKITKISKISPHNNSETVTNEHDKEIHKERYISPKERQKIIDDLRLIK